MNPKIVRSLELLHELQSVVVKDYAMLSQSELLELYHYANGFYCFNTALWHSTLPEEAAVADTEWLCSHEGSVDIAGIMTTIRKPFCAQFIGLSGNSYIWFQPGDYRDPKTLSYCDLGELCNTLVVHNIAADRPMFLQSHNRNTNEGPNFFCTMSAHLLCAGVSSQQSWNYQMGSDKPRVGGLKNLVDVYNFWSQTEFPRVLELGAKRGNVKAEAKEIRDIFYKGDLKTVLGMLQELVTYGMSDVQKVVEVYRNLFPAWLDTLPAKESRYFYLKRAKVNYSLSDQYASWFRSTESKYQVIKEQINELIQANNQAKLSEFKLEIDKEIEADPISHIPDSFCLKNKPRTLAKKWYPNAEGKSYLLAQALVPGVQAVISKWQVKYNAGNWAIDNSCSPKWAKTESSCDSPISQLLLDATYKYSSDLPAAPVMFDKNVKFVYYRGAEMVKITSPKKGLNTKDNTGSILAKDYIALWETGVLSCSTDTAKQITVLMSQISYWTSVRSRLAELAVLVDYDQGLVSKTTAQPDLVGYN
jgi:hypothetical protein